MTLTRTTTPFFFRANSCASFLVAVFALFASSALNAQTAAPAEIEENKEAVPLLEGDVISIKFPAAEDLSSSQKIRRDGRITLPLVGEVVLAGLTPIEAEKRLLELYDDQLVTKEVSVTVTSSNYTFYVNGAVLNPGKKVSDRTLSALEAIMEAGGPSPSANLKKVTISRKVGTKWEQFKINLKDVISGKKESVFQVENSDIINVPEKFVIF